MDNQDNQDIIRQIDMEIDNLNGYHGLEEVIMACHPFRKLVIIPPSPSRNWTAHSQSTRVACTKSRRESTAANNQQELPAPNREGNQNDENRLPNNRRGKRGTRAGWKRRRQYQYSLEPYTYQQHGKLASLLNAMANGHEANYNNYNRGRGNGGRGNRGRGNGGRGNRGRGDRGRGDRGQGNSGRGNRAMQENKAIDSLKMIIRVNV